MQKMERDKPIRIQMRAENVMKIVANSNQCIKSPFACNLYASQREFSLTGQKQLEAVHAFSPTKDHISGGR